MKVNALSPPYHVNGRHVEQIGWQYQQQSILVSLSTDKATLELLLRIGLTVCFPDWLGRYCVKSEYQWELEVDEHKPKKHTLLLGWSSSLFWNGKYRENWFTLVQLINWRYAQSKMIDIFRLCYWHLYVIGNDQSYYTHPFVLYGIPYSLSPSLSFRHKVWFNYLSSPS